MTLHEYDGAADTLRILIVDNDPTQRRMLQRMFEQCWACDVQIAVDGLEALNLILKDGLKPELIVLDIEMPYVTGLEFLMLVHHRRALVNTPIIVCSVADSVETVREVLRFGVKDFLSKPVDKTAFVKKVGPIVKALGIPQATGSAKVR